MKKFQFYFQLALIAAIAAALLFTACRKDEYAPQMILVTNYSSGIFYLNGSGEATIDWGDDTPSETYTFAKENSLSQRFGHSYSTPPPCYNYYRRQHHVLGLSRKTRNKFRPEPEYGADIFELQL